MVTRIRVFGALKEFGEAGVITLELPENCSTSLLKSIAKEQLMRKFSATFKEALVDRSAVACGSRVLREEEIIDKAAELALLPPVCGG